MKNEELKYLIFIALLFTAFAFKIYSQDYRWVEANGAYQGKINSLAENQKNEVFAATRDGIFKSTDNGYTWIKIFYGGYWNFHIAVSNNGYIFSGTMGNGIIRSKDNGRTWKAKNNGVSSYTTSCLFINPADVIFAGFQSDGLYRSTNYAESWIKTSGIPSNTDVTSITVKGDLLFAGTWDGLYKSLDQGINWERVNKSIFNYPYNRIKVVAAGNSGDLVVGANHRISLSSNSGNNWEVISDVTVATILFLDEYIIAGGIIVSTDRGSSWINTNGISGGMNAMIKLVNNSLLAGGGSFNISSDNGLNWTHQEFNLSTYEITVLYSVGNYLLAYKRLGWRSLFYSTNEGGNWNVINEGLETLFLESLTSDLAGEYIFAGARSTISRAVIGEFDWSHVLTGQYGQDIGPFRAFAVNSNNKIYAGDRFGIYISSDLGLNWIFKDLNPPTVIDTVVDVRALAINSQNVVFAGSQRYGIYRSTDDGNTWESVNNGLTDFDIYALAIDSKNNLYAGTSYYGGMFRSTDHGDLWEPINTGLTDSSIKALSINSKDEIFAATRDSGVFFSDDSGKNWQAINTGLTNLATLSLSVNADGRIFVGTASRIDGKGGVFKLLVEDTSNSTIQPPEIPESFILYNNFPNPFNSVTKIRFDLPQNKIVSIDIYDILGQKVQTLLNEFKTANNYEIEFNAAKLPSGIYFYQLTAGQYIETKKMVLLK